MKTENLHVKGEICGCVARVTARRAFLSVFFTRLSQCLTRNIGLKARRALFCLRGTAGQFEKRGRSESETMSKMFDMSETMLEDGRQVISTDIDVGRADFGYV